MRIGYACKLVDTGEFIIKSCTQKNAVPEKLRELIAHNLHVLDRMIDYNIRSRIPMFRISSDIIPFASSPSLKVDWQEQSRAPLRAIGEKALGHGMRLSMHPGQYTVLNSPNGETVRSAVADLEYHTRFLDLMGLGPEHKIILHIGGAYGDKQSALDRFARRYGDLSPAVKARLVIENDDRIFHIQDVLYASGRTGAPVVFDSLHHQVNPCPAEQTTAQWVTRCGQTWRPQDGPQKLHYSQQAPGKKPGAHSGTIAAGEFLSFLQSLESREPDIMLEVKDKNLSALKCIHCTAPDTKIKDLEQAWARWKYFVLERSPSVYQQIRRLLKDKTACPALPFYELIEEAQQADIQPGRAENAALHVWGYFKALASPKEKARFEAALAKAAQSGSFRAVKKLLWRLAAEYGQQYLLESYYFLE